MSDRRYDDEEVSAIFRAAAEGLPVPAQRAARNEGLTLADLQGIGREVGISEDAVAHAAGALDARRGSSQRTLLGLPIGVTRIVALDRRLTDDEWERLVVQVRDVFQARGVTRSDGSLRQWTNGNLQVLLEPTETGQQLRFATVHGGARASIGAGLAALGIAAATAIATAASGNLGHSLPGVLFIALVSAGMIANGALRLPRWARLRGSQMEALAAQALTRVRE
ncbi:MAG: hypothetical protein ACREND_17190 [Gemmatimonadaceae bacterium]